MGMTFTTADASRNLASTDLERVVRCNSDIPVVLTVLTDQQLGISGAVTVACAAYQQGTGTVSFAAGADVTIVGQPWASTQYTVNGILRVGANQWAYV